MAGRDHPFFGRAVAGLVWKTTPHAKIFAGLGRMVRYSVADDPGNTGLNLRYAFARPSRDGVELSTTLDGFASSDSDQLRTLDWTTSLRFKLGRNLSAVMRNTTFLWEDDVVGTTASRKEFFVGLGFDRALRRY